MSLSPVLRVTLDLMARGFADELGLPPLGPPGPARPFPDLPSLAMLPGLEDRAEPVGLYGWAPGEAQ